MFWRKTQDDPWETQIHLDDGRVLTRTHSAKWEARDFSDSVLRAGVCINEDDRFEGVPAKSVVRVLARRLDNGEAPK